MLVIRGKATFWVATAAGSCASMYKVKDQVFTDLTMAGVILAHSILEKTKYKHGAKYSTSSIIAQVGRELRRIQGSEGRIMNILDLAPLINQVITKNEADQVQY